MDIEYRVLQVRGWMALLLAIVGTAVPVSTYLALDARYRNDLAWQEGCGFFMLIACLVAGFISEGVALWIARRAGDALPARIAGAVVILCIVPGCLLLGDIVLCLIQDAPH